MQDRSVLLSGIASTSRLSRSVSQSLPCIAWDLTSSLSVLTNKLDSTSWDITINAEQGDWVGASLKVILISLLHYISPFTKQPFQVHVFLTSFPYFPFLLMGHQPPVTPSLILLASPLSHPTFVILSPWQWTWYWLQLVEFDTGIETFPDFTNEHSEVRCEKKILTNRTTYSLGW
jgi:hypothetical protein